MDSEITELLAYINEFRQKSRLEIEESISSFYRRSETIYQNPSPNFTNVFRLLGERNNEDLHARFFKSLMDPLGPFGTSLLDLILKDLGFDQEKRLQYLKPIFRTAQEVSHDESRIDVEVVGLRTRGFREFSYLIHYEIKWKHKEGDGQLRNQYADAQRKAMHLGIADEHMTAVFISKRPDQTPSDDRFRHLLWSQIFKHYQTCIGLHPDATMDLTMAQYFEFIGELT